jgi:hypothetical protein
MDLFMRHNKLPELISTKHLEPTYFLNFIFPLDFPLLCQIIVSICCLMFLPLQSLVLKSVRLKKDVRAFVRNIPKNPFVLKSQ